MNDDVFEWRLVAARLRSGWRAVSSIAALAFVLGAGLSLARDERYVAEALLAVTKPAVVAEFDQRLAERQLDPSFPYDVATLRAYAELATTQALGHDVARRLDAGPADVDALLRRISVEAMADGSLLQIRARAADPAAASELANAWSEALVERASLVFGSRLADDGVRAQREEAEGALASAQAALNEFHKTSRLPARELEQESLTFAYQEALAHDQRLEQVLLDIETLRAQAGTTPGTSAALAALSLRLRALSASQPLPVDLQLGADGLAGDLGPDAIDALREAVLEARQRLGSQLEALPGRLSAVTEELEVEKAERTRLERARDLAQERYIALARKVDELELSRAASGTELRLAARAAEPTGADWATPLRHAVVAGLCGGLLGAVLVLLRSRRHAPTEASTRPLP